jgi:hypothetical protein
MSFSGLPSLPYSGLDHGSSVTGVSLIKLFYLSLTVGSVASLALPTNVRLGWKELSLANSSLFSSTISDEEKSVMSLTSYVSLTKLFYL